MSSEGENNTKNISSEGEEKKNPDDKEKPEKMQVDNDDKENEKTDNDDSDGKSKENAKENDGRDKMNSDAKDKDKGDDDDGGKVEKKSNKAQKEAENDTKSEDSSDKEDDENDKEDDDKKSVPLLDQPLEISGTRERKKVQRFNDDFSSRDSKEGAKLEIPTGKGVTLGEIPRIDASISRFKNEDLKLLHRLLFKTPGKTTMIKKNIKKFNGFDFSKDSDEYAKKLGAAQKFEVKQLKSMCEMLDLEKKGNKDEIAERILEFLVEPKDSGKAAGGGRPKRTAAVKANNRGYSSHDDSYSSDEKPSPRGRRDKGKRSNLKDESSSESDEEFRPSDASEEKPRVNKLKRKSKKPQSDEEEVSEVEESAGSSEESEVRKDEPKSKKRKVVNSKAAKPKGTPGRRGRKPAAAAPATPVAATPKKKTPAKRGRKPAQQNSSEESEHRGEEEEEEGSSSEDEPLVKKPKNPQPPTDEEIKSYVKDILEGANLEEITMKTVCKQVYAHYPDFDLTHKKDYIKTTVKSLIST